MKYSRKSFVDKDTQEETIRSSLKNRLLIINKNMFCHLSLSNNLHLLNVVKLHFE